MKWGVMSLLNRVEKLEQTCGVGNESGVCVCHGVGKVDIRITDEEDEKTMADARRVAGDKRMAGFRQPRRQHLVAGV